MSRYPKAEWVPWKYPNSAGMATYYKGQCFPIGAVLHGMQGWASTARQWATAGMYPKSWQFTIDFDGSVMQHLEFNDGGYHAGITDAQARQHRPTWPLWKGRGRNVNTYMLGIEGAGFATIPAYAGDGRLITSNPLHKSYAGEAQRESLKELTQWIASELGVAHDRAHFPSHAEIDLVNRANDPLPLAEREELWRWLFDEEEGMSSAEFDRLVKAVFGSQARLEELEDPTKGIAPLEGRVSRFESNDGPIGKRLTALEGRPAGTGDGSIPEHTHYNHERSLGVVHNPQRDT